MNRPETNEFDPYYNTYISLVEGDNVLPVLDAQAGELRSMFSNVPEEKGTFAYADGKWTIKELLSHLIDGERMFAYRALRISRGDKTPIEGFEQDGYIENSNANNRSFADLLEEFDLQRRSNILLLNNLSDEGSRRMGTASEKAISARALALHHGRACAASYSYSERAVFGMKQEASENLELDDKMAPYLYLQSPGVNSFEEFDEFKKRFPDCKDTLIVWTFARLVYEKHGVRILGF